MLTIGYSNQGANDTYLLYKKDSGFHEYLKRDINSIGRFKAKTISENSSAEENLGVSHAYFKNKTIETSAFLEFHEGDIVFDVRRNVAWRIADNGITVNEDSQMTQFSSRPRKNTILTLIRKAE